VGIYLLVSYSPKSSRYIEPYHKLLEYADSARLYVTPPITGAFFASALIGFVRETDQC
jgi:hypothetical protein